jgi:hypothetical protein
MYRLLSDDPKVLIRKAVPIDCEKMAPNLRPIDVEEIAAVTDFDTLKALQVSYRSSARRYTVEMDGDPVIIGGVASHPTEVFVGIPWMLATTAFDRLKPVFIEHHAEIINEIFGGYKTLVNMALTSNTTALRWLQALGFELLEPQPKGRNGELLTSFILRRL